MRLIAFPVVIILYLEENLSQATNGCRRPGNTADRAGRRDGEDAVIGGPKHVDWVQIVERGGLASSRAQQQRPSSKMPEAIGKSVPAA